MPRSECSPCKRVFSSLSAFDRHQQVDYTRRPAVVCLEPATVGLVWDPKRELWAWPPDDRSRARAENFRAEQEVPGVSV